MDALDPELDVAVLPSDAADPRVQTPTSEQPGWDPSSTEHLCHGPEDLELSMRPLIHATSVAANPA